jgi:nucleoside-diphosphate-sugar epimerase
VKSLVLGGTGFVGRRLIEILVAEGNTVTVLNRGVTPGSDLRAGHANTLEWYLRSGAAAVDDALSDPLWNRTFDFEYEAEVAAYVSNRLRRTDA